MPRRKQTRLTDVKDMRSILRLTYDQGLSVRAVSERLKLIPTSWAPANTSDFLTFRTPSD